MDASSLAVADAVLHEGLLLYPYRRSALKNRERWGFGVLVPPAFAKLDSSESADARLECLLAGEPTARLQVCLRFLHEIEDEPVECRTLRTPWRDLAELAAAPARVSLRQGSLRAELTLSTLAVTHGRHRVTVEVHNTSNFDGVTRAEVLPTALLSTQILLQTRGGRFDSAIDPDEEVRALAADCRSKGLWPVLLGPVGKDDAVLAAPIILPDHPDVAPESRVSMFDATEIDEMLALRVHTLTENESEEARRDPRIAALFSSLEAMPETERAGLLGAWRSHPGRSFCVGDRVRVKRELKQCSDSTRRRDILDVAVAGRTALVQDVMQDREGRIHVAIVLDDDPGRDLGLEGWPGHRWFFAPEELERP
jgi:hypothetical protein